MTTNRTAAMIRTFFMDTSLPITESAGGSGRPRPVSAWLRRLRGLHPLAVPLEDHPGEGRVAGVGDPVHHPGGRVDRVALGGREFLAVEVPAAGAFGHEQELLVRVLVRRGGLLAPGVLGGRRARAGPPRRLALR